MLDDPVPLKKDLLVDISNRFSNSNFELSKYIRSKENACVKVSGEMKGIFFSQHQEFYSK